MSICASGCLSESPRRCEYRVVARDLELAAVAAIREALPDAEIQDLTPGWLMRPGRCEPARIFEFDESQHFTAYRATTLRAYLAWVDTAFPRDIWLRASESSTKKLGTTGGWGKAKPPLFPDPGGRHVQRAFRDALADLLPAIHGWAPTLRIADFEVQAWLQGTEAGPRMRALLQDRLA
jgi:hypothetical protein